MREHSSTLGIEDPGFENIAVLQTSGEKSNPHTVHSSLLFYSSLVSFQYLLDSRHNQSIVFKFWLAASALFERQHLPVSCILHAPRLA